MPMIPSYQDMLAQALQAQQAQQMQAQQGMAAQAQSQQNRSIFDNPYFGNSLMKMGATLLANTDQGWDAWQTIGQGALAFTGEQERLRQQELENQSKMMQMRDVESNIAARQLAANLSQYQAQVEAQQMDAARKAAQSLPEMYRRQAEISPLSAVDQYYKDEALKRQNDMELRRQLAVVNAQGANQMAMENLRSQQNMAQRFWEMEATRQKDTQAKMDVFNTLGIPVAASDGKLDTSNVPNYLKPVVGMVKGGNYTEAAKTAAKINEEKLANESQLKEILTQQKNLAASTSRLRSNLNKDFGLGNYTFQTVTGPAQYLPNAVLGKVGQQVYNDIETIKSNTTLNKLLSARAAGITFGGLNLAELQTAANASAKLSATDKPQTILTALDDLEKLFAQVEKNALSDYSKKYGIEYGIPQGQTQTLGQSKIPQGSTIGTKHGTVFVEPSSGSK